MSQPFSFIEFDIISVHFNA